MSWFESRLGNNEPRGFASGFCLSGSGESFALHGGDKNKTSPVLTERGRCNGQKCGSAEASTGGEAGANPGRAT